MPTIDENFADENTLQYGVSFDNHCLVKQMKDTFEVTCETTRTRIDDNQDSRSVLGQSKGHTSRLKSQ
jgi:hypothetical protein